MKQKQEKITAFIITEFMQLLCVLYISVWVISPPLGYGTAYRIVAISAAILWSWIELLKRPDTFFNPSLATLCAMIFIFYSAIAGFWIEGFEDFVRNIQVYIFFLFLIFYESYRKRNIRQLKIVFWTSLIVLPIWLGATLNACINTDDVSRLITSSSEAAQEFSKQGVGGYGLVYSMIVAIPILLFLIKNNSCFNRHATNIFTKFIFNLIIVANLMLGCAVIIKAGFSIAMILMIASIVTTLLIGGKKPLALLSAVGILLSITILMTYVSREIADYAVSNFKVSMYEIKINDVIKSIDQKENIGTLADRTERYERSIKLFLENPVLGTLRFSDSGRHSAIFDRFATYGLFVGALFAYSVFYLPFRYLVTNAGSSYGMVLSVAFVVTVLSCLNTVFASLGYMVFVFYPVAKSYIDDGEFYVNSAVPPRK